MPWLKCPTCGAIAHLLVSENPKEWYSRFHPGITTGDIVPGKCPFCFSNIQVGDQIIVREMRDATTKTKPGRLGHIIAVHASSDGHIYKAQFDDQVETLSRFEFRKARPNETGSPPARETV